MNLVKIKSIRKTDEQHTSYDIMTKNNHNFFANDILVHNSNISFLIHPELDHVKIFSRNQEVTNDNFYNCADVFTEFIEKIEKMKSWAAHGRVSVRIFGELFGPGIQKGVEYGNERQIRIFDIMVNDRLQSQESTENFLYDLGLGALFVPKIGVFPSFKEAMEVNEEFDSMILGVENNVAEGFVIKPYKDVFVDGQGSVFYVKKKNDKFKEKQKVKKIRTETQYTEEVNQWRETFLSYINANRAESVFSKEGEIASYSDIGKYIPLIHQDALEDFRKDEDFVDEYFTKSEKKYIFNSSKEIVELLKLYL